MTERSRTTRAITLAAATVCALGCSKNPFMPHVDDYGPRVPVERIRTIEPLALDGSPMPEIDSDEEDRALTEPPERVRAGEPVQVSLEQARAWTLSNNLDLRTALIDPTIADTVVNEEEGRFEAVFNLSARRTETDQPTDTTLVGSQIETTSINVGLDIPLRTGGTISLDAPLNRTQTNNAFTILNPSFTTDASLSISQPLLRGAGRRANTHGIRVAALSRGIDLARTKLEVIRQIAAADRAYWRLYAAWEVLDVRKQQLELAQVQLDRAQRLVRAGREPEVEIIRAESGVADRIEDIIIAENEVLLQQRELKRIMNAPGLEIVDDTIVRPLSKPDPVRFDLDPIGLTEAAIANRMELLELELQLAIDSSTINFRRNEALPLFTLDYIYRVNGLGASFSEALDQASDGDFADWSLGLNAEIPLGNEERRSRLQRAIIERLQRLSSRDSRRLAITQETLDAIDALEAGWRRILAARRATLLSGRTLAAEERQFDVGRRTSTEVLNAQTTLADSQLAELRALVEYEIAKIDLAFATGTLLGAARIYWQPLDPRQDDSAGSPDTYSRRDAPN